MRDAANEAELFRRAAEFPLAPIDDGVLAIDRAGGCCYFLNSTSAAVWDLLKQPARLACLCDTLRQRFEVDRETCLRDLSSILAEMEQAGLVCRA